MSHISSSEKKTCFVLNDGEIGYPGLEDDKGDESSTGKLRSPPPVGDVKGSDTARSLPAAVAEWRSATVLSNDSEDESSCCFTPSRATSLRSFGKSPTPSPLLAPLHEPSAFTHVIRKRKRSSTTPTHSQQKRRRPIFSHFLLLPAEVLTPICLFSTFSSIVSFHQTCVAMHRMIPPSLEVLDITDHIFNKHLASMLIRWSLANLRLKCFALNCDVQERYAGVVGFVMRASPHLRALELKGTPPFWLVREAVKNCSNLKEFLNYPRQGSDITETDTQPGPVMNFILNGSKCLSSLTLTTVRCDSSCWAGHTTDKISHGSLRKLRLENVSSSVFTGKCCLPNLSSLAVFEGSGTPLSMNDILNITWSSANLIDLTVAAGFTWCASDVATLKEKCPKIERLRLKAGSDGGEKWVAAAPTSQMSHKTLQELFRSFSLKELHVEAAGWDPHWTAYHDLIGTDSLVLQTELFDITSPLLDNLRTPTSSFRNLTTAILYGDVTNALVWGLVEVCPLLERLEVYLLPPSIVDDDILNPPNGAFPKENLKTFHLHDGNRHLSPAAFHDIGKKLPCLTSLGVVGTPKDAGFERVLSSLTNSLPASLSHLVIGPVLDTSAELLCLIKETTSLTSLSLAWDGGELPTRDDEFPSALGLETLSELARLINPKLVVKDVGCGHFNILL
eukprot:TRINITY_DN21617_c1_g1_i1.p1 TRINITY_DN21617_c1_g1~~TRINITY_DN21617_c1_g1_i1.p1  ORF type:complete len:684 (+),score=103.20 TRINITY_DN21617_c1_g1_i1:29-2053(+)